MLDISEVDFFPTFIISGVMKLQPAIFRPREVVKHVLQTAAASLKKELTLEGFIGDDVPLEVLSNNYLFSHVFLSKALTRQPVPDPESNSDLLRVKTEFGFTHSCICKLTSVTLWKKMKYLFISLSSCRAGEIFVNFGISLT